MTHKADICKTWLQLRYLLMLQQAPEMLTSILASTCAPAGKFLKVMQLNNPHSGNIALQAEQAVVTGLYLLQALALRQQLCTQHTSRSAPRWFKDIS